MEFKGSKKGLLWMALSVDIGTEWNLKMPEEIKERLSKTVDIGTEWNLKFGSDLFLLFYLGLI